MCENLLELEVGNPKIGQGAVSVDAGWQPKGDVLVPTSLAAFDGVGSSVELVLDAVGVWAALEGAVAGSPLSHEDRISACG